MNSKQRECLRAMRHALSYAAWHQAAAELDRLEGRDDWKAEDASEDYDWRLLRSRLGEIRAYRAKGQVEKLVHHLRQGLHRNLGNIANPELHEHCLTGTKRLIRDYVNEVVDALDFVCNTPIPSLDAEAKLRLFRETAQSFGRSALMLSGGATLGLFHLGVVRAMYAEGLLPEVISGSSAGAVIAAAIGTRTPESLSRFLDAKARYFNFWRPLGVGQMLKRRALMDQSRLRAVVAENVADMTFEQAQRLSGRIVNVTVSPAGENQSPRLLNYLTFPFLCLREAVVASSAVPLLFEPAMLMTRDEKNRRVPYLPQLRWIDGSLKSDLPFLRMARLHNVNHFVVSQTNPHVLPFISSSHGGGAISMAREHAYAAARSSALGLMNLGMAGLPKRLTRGFGTASSILDQAYSGHLTIVPEASLWRYLRVTANPDEKLVQRFILEGERATWPRLSAIRMQTRIALTLEDCVYRLEQARDRASHGDKAPPAARKRVKPAP